jgi:hypothetical protein
MTVALLEREEDGQGETPARGEDTVMIDSRVVYDMASENGVLHQVIT